MSSLKKRKDGCYIYQIYYEDSNTKLRRRYQKNHGRLTFPNEDAETEDEFQDICDDNFVRDGLTVSIPLSKAIDDYIIKRKKRVAKNTLSPHTLRTDKLALGLFKLFMKKNKYGDIRIGKITESHIEHFKNERLDEVSSETTVWVNLRTLKSFFSYQLKTKKSIKTHPFIGIKIPTEKTNIDESVINFFVQLRKFIFADLMRRKQGLPIPTEFEENEKLQWFYANTWFIHYVWIMMNTGARNGEISILKWHRSADIPAKLTSKSFSYVTRDESSFVIYFKKVKRTIPITDKVKHSLEMLPQYRKDGETLTEFVFEDERSGKPHHTTTIGNLFKKLIIALKLDSKFTPHSLRHGFASDLLTKTSNIFAVSELLGHKSVKTTQNIYAHVRANDLLPTLNLISQDD